MSSAGLGVDLEHVDAGVVVRVRGELDLHTHQQLREVFKTAPVAGAGLVVDLSEVTFMDSSGIGALGVAQRVVEEGRLLLVVASTHLRKLITIAGLDRSARLCATVPEAIAALRPEH